MQFTTARQLEIIAAIQALSAAVTETETHDDLVAQLAAVTAERDAALAQLAAMTSERDAALAQVVDLQQRLSSIAAEVQVLTAADAQEDAARASILAKAQGG